MPVASTVASAIAVGSDGSLRAASSNHAENSANGSSASVKLPDINEFAFSMEVHSRHGIRDVQVVATPVRSTRGLRYNGTTRERLSCLGVWRCALIAAALVLGCANSGCSYRLGGMSGDKSDQTAAIKPAKASSAAAPAQLAAANHPPLNKGAVA